MCKDVGCCWVVRRHGEGWFKVGGAREKERGGFVNVDPRCRFCSQGYIDFIKGYVISYVVDVSVAQCVFHLSLKNRLIYTKRSTSEICASH